MAQRKSSLVYGIKCHPAPFNNKRTEHDPASMTPVSESGRLEPSKLKQSFMASNATWPDMFLDRTK